MAIKKVVTDTLMLLGWAVALLCLTSMLTSFDILGLKAKPNMALVAPDLLLLGFVLSVILVKNPDKTTNILRKLSIVTLIVLFICVLILVMNAFVRATQAI